MLSPERSRGPQHHSYSNISNDSSFSEKRVECAEYGIHCKQCIGIVVLLLCECKLTAHRLHDQSRDTPTTRDNCLKYKYINARKVEFKDGYE